jgi:hypothetical protein
MEATVVSNLLFVIAFSLVFTGDAPSRQPSPGAPAPTKAQASADQPPSGGAPSSPSHLPTVLPPHYGDGDSAMIGHPCTNGNEKRGGYFLHRFIGAYCDEFQGKDDSCAANGDSCKSSNGNAGGNCGKNDAGENECGNGNGPEAEEKPRRALPAPFNSPPFPTAEYQGFPLIGVPPSDAVYPFMKAVYDGPYGDAIKDTRVKFYGWVNASGTWSTAKNSNTPTSYWINPNSFDLQQLVFRLERQADTVQTDRIDWGFRSTGLYGIDYRYMTAGGWGSDQLLVNNLLRGWDPTEQYVEVYIPGIAQGMLLTIGRWIATPDIETQFAPDNYLGTHSILFTHDIYTQTGVMATVMLNPQWTVQAAIHAGADMAPWYAGAIPTGMFGVRWVSRDNNDSFYTVLNAINNAEFQYFDLRGRPAGHHNYNIIQTTWQHRFNKEVQTRTEVYYMWENNSALGGTPSIGPFQFNTGGGIGPTIPGTSKAYGVLNYTMFQVSNKDFITVRNEWWKDETGFRSGFPGNYTSNTIGLTHNFNSTFQIRPEIGYYRNWNNPAFDNGARKNLLLYGFDVTLRF